MIITTDNFEKGLWLVIAVFILVILYHLLFVVVDLRRVMKRLDAISKDLHDVILSPLKMADSLMGSLIQFLEKKNRTREKKHVKSSVDNAV